MLIGLLIALVVGAYFYIRRTPHGLVEFKSGLVLKVIPALDSMPTPKLRTSLEKFVAKSAHKVNKSLPVSEVRDFIIPTRHGDIKARLYNNSKGLKDELLFFFHGGGWCIGSIDTHNEQARRLAIATDLPLLSIDYSLSPEVKFPHAFEEGVDAMLWAKDNYQSLGVSQPKLIPIGDSAGGNMAITTTMECIRLGHNDLISRVIPIYPVTDGRPLGTESRKQFAKGFYLTQKAMEVFTNDYLEDISHANDPRASPLAESDLSQFPPSFILTAGFDPLRDEGEAFAQKLQQQGAKVTLKRYHNALHAFFGLKDFGSKGLQAVEDVSTWLKGGQLNDVIELK